MDWDQQPETPEETGPQTMAIAFRQPKPEEKSRRPVIVAAVLAVLALIAGVTFVIGFTGDEPSGSPASNDLVSERTAEEQGGSGEADQEPAAEPTSGAAADVKVGVFRGTKPAEVGEFEEWLGRDIAYAVDYSNRDQWDDVANPTYMLQAWEGSGYRMVYGVVMLPAHDDSATLAAGAAGDYDDYYRTLAQNLVEYGQGDSIIRLAWEFNVRKGRWNLQAADRDDFVAYWRNIVTTMRSVPGAEKLEFDWNVNNGGETFDSTVYYPGEEFVDYIGVDVYDIAWTEGSYPYPSGCNTACRKLHQEVAWDSITDAGYGLDFWSAFAAEQGKPLSMPEWGLWDRTETDSQGGMDNPFFIQQMFEFIDDPQNNVAYQAYFDVNPEGKGKHQLADLPRGQARFKKLFGSGG
ncbi:glycoside hydrolase family 26 protein [Kineosporia babensis]|uniref:GH26 domain-containing protein n=1 Tax=Kineosporia babensis TaxID=499548 RepID=A0A9X1NM22_9ACTN|nr:hypothetical protein [Kineosporia babensis]